jgi:hypothetical protein
MFSYIGLKHLLHSSLEKSITERSIEYFKDRTENFDDSTLHAILLSNMI